MPSDEASHGGGLGSSSGLRSNQQQQQQPQLVKCIIIGDSGAGKSSILSRFTENRFSSESNQTIGVEFASRMIKVKDSNIKLHIWDTAGQERYRSITRSYYRGAAICMIVYDITRHESFEHLTRWMSDVNCLAQKKVTVLLLGNKSDQASAREVSQVEAAAFAQEHEISHIEASAKSGDNVEEAFSLLLRNYLADLEAGGEISGGDLSFDPENCGCGDPESGSGIGLRAGGKKGKKCCAD